MQENYQANNMQQQTGNVQYQNQAPQQNHPHQQNAQGSQQLMRPDAVNHNQSPHQGYDQYPQQNVGQQPQFIQPDQVKKKRYTVSAKVDSFRKPGEKKDTGVYANLGMAFENNDGSIRVNIRSLPLPTSEWDGSIFLNVIEDDEQQAMR